LHLKSQTEFGLLKVQIRVADAPQGPKTELYKKLQFTSQMIS